MTEAIDKPRTVAEKKARERQRAAERKIGKIDPQLHAKAGRLAKALLARRRD